MPEPQHDGPNEARLGELAQSLFDMRDALTRIAMLLRDQEFEFNQLQRDAALEQVQELLKKLNSP